MMSNLIDLMSELEAEILQLRMLLREVAIPELCSYFHVPLVTKEAVSYTHLTLPTSDLV